MAKKSRSKRKRRIPGLVITVILLIMAVEFSAMLAVTQMIPGYLILVILLIVVTFVLLIWLLTRNTRHKVSFVLGTLMAILLAAILVIGNFYIFTTYDTLNRISGVTVQTSEVSVFVLKDDPAETIEDASDYVFGIMTGLDNDNTEGAVGQINELLDREITVKEEDGVIELIDSLLDGECGAIILNYAYLSIIEDIEGYEDISDRIRELDMFTVETVIEEPAEETYDGDNIIRLYISGIDTRGSSIINTRSDVNIIAVINTDTRQILLVSTPRDYYVPLSISNGREDKLTHAGIYGVDVSMDTLGMLYDISLNYYFKVNFAGFVDIIDALGGIEVESEYAFTSSHNSSYKYVVGTNYLNGSQALEFARERYAFSSGDRQRGRNQMAVIEGVINKAMSPDLLANYTSVLDSLEGSFETNVPYDMIADIVRMQLEEGGGWNIESYSVDGTGASRIPYSMSAYAYVMIPDQTTVENAKILMKQVEDGEVIDLSVIE